MGVEKLRSVADMPRPAALPPGDPANLRLAFSLMDLTCRLSRFSRVPGVRKFRSVEEMDAHRRAWEQAESRRIREGRNRQRPAG